MAIRGRNPHGAQNGDSDREKRRHATGALELGDASDGGHSRGDDVCPEAQAAPAFSAAVGEAHPGTFVWPPPSSWGVEVGTSAALVRAFWALDNYGDLELADGKTM